MTAWPSVTVEWVVRLVDGLELWTAALGLGEPWRVSTAEFAAESSRLDLRVTYPQGTRFPCPEPGCGQDRWPVHDTEDKTWRHLDFFQHQAFVHARVPRVRCPEHGVRLVAVPWARPGSGFTVLSEALTSATVMPMHKAVTRPGLEHARWLWLNGAKRLRLQPSKGAIAIAYLIAGKLPRPTVASTSPA